jgi:hypothetical protein
MVNASPLLTWSFVTLVAIVATLFVLAVHRSAARAPGVGARSGRHTAIAAVAVAAWLGLTLALAASGRLSFVSRPPTMAILILASVVLAFSVSLSRAGLRIATAVPLAALVGAQAFRFPLELILHRAYREGLMPVQMSYSGFNLDILTGLSAIVVALLLVRNPQSLVAVRVWNTAGMVLLANIVTIAILSAPTPLRVFHNEPSNVWITHAPWVWLPTVFVVAAVLGHVLVLRRLRAEMSAAVAGRSGAVSAAAGLAER